MQIEQMISTAVISAMAVVIIQGLYRKFFEKGAIVDVAECKEKNDKCRSEVELKFNDVYKRLDKGELYFRRLERYARVHSLALMELCNKPENVKTLRDILEGRDQFEE
jgi:hypothetical protein